MKAQIKKIIKKEYDKNVLDKKNLKDRLGTSKDIKIRDIYINNNPKLIVTLIYIDGLVNLSDISDYILRPILDEKIFINCNTLENIIEEIKKGSLCNAGQSITNDIENTISEVMNGASLLLFNDIHKAAIFDTIKYDKRSISEPTVENVTKGAKDSFVENYRTNTATIRKKIKNPNLVIQDTVIGEQTKTVVGIIYMSNIVNDKLLKEVITRLKSLSIDNILTTSVIEDTLSDNNFCVFPQVVSTERPDSFCAQVIEGRVGIVIDGIPFGFIVPATMNQFMQTAEDYSRNTVVASIIRIIRFICFFISLTMPAVYIAITTYHPEMIPTNLALFIAKSREGVTFPVIVETILMLGAFEILFEAGLRIPKTIGQAVSIVGTLVIGQAAVEARLVSPSVVVVIAITSISSFAMPNQDFSNAVRLWRFVFAIFSGFLGLIGIVLAIILITFKLCSLESYGVPYLSPFMSNSIENMLNDSIFRISLKKNKYRPKDLKTKNKKRVGG